VDTRVVAATNRGLKAAVAAKQFREDLYFRLSVFPITVPPLRERGGDVPILAHHFVERFCRDLNKKPLPFSVDALGALQSYAWPGNVRELQNCIERAVILCDGDTIHARHLSLTFQTQAAAGDRDGEPGHPAPQAPANPLGQLDLSGTLGEAVRRVTAQVERLKVGEALRAANGNKERAAEALQISYKSLLQKQREHGITE
jgi:DNA-binding NtrC family response regulator